MKLRHCFALIGVMLLARLAAADGYAFKYARDIAAFVPVAEGEQVAVISVRDGRERMALAVSLGLASEERAVWIVPVPGTPETVAIDICTEMPWLGGEELVRLAKSRIELVTPVALLFGVFSACMTLPFVPSLGGVSTKGLSEHRVVEEHGLRLATVTARSLDELGDYFRSNDVAIASDRLATLANYLDGEHVLVVGWIASLDALLHDYPNLRSRRWESARRPAIEVTFPSERPWFPLVATSGYGDETIPLRLRVEGHHQMPADWNWKPNYLAWCRDEQPKDSAACKFFHAKPGSSIEYTSMLATVAAREFTRDLTLVPADSPKLRVAVGLVDGYLWLLPSVAVVVVCSYLAGGFAGVILFWKWRRPAWIGLANVLTLVGVMAVLRNEKMSEWSPVWNGRKDVRVALRFLAWFVVLYTILVCFIGGLVELQMKRGMGQ